MEMKSSITSGIKTASAIICTESALFYGVEIITDGTNAATIIVYNSQDATGPVLFKGTVPGSSNFGGSTYETPVRAGAGIYVAISGTGASCVVYFDYA
jgi:hypothetical protein